MVFCSMGRADETVWACGTSYGTGVFAGSAGSDMSATSSCPAVQPTEGFQVASGSGSITRGDAARFQADAPEGLEIVSAGVPSMAEYNVNTGAGYGGGFYWQGGGSEVTKYQTESSGWGVRIRLTSAFRRSVESVSATTLQPRRF